MVLVWGLALVGSLSVYELLNVPQTPLHHFDTVIDNITPLVPVFVVPYLSLYVLGALGAVAFIRHGVHYFGIVALAVLLDLAISYIFYLFYQTEVIRPNISGSDIFSQLVRQVYANDRPYNDFPSLHVSLSIIVASFWHRYICRGSWLIATWAVLIAASTILIKQHYLWDVVGGIGAATLSVYAAVRFEEAA